MDKNKILEYIKTLPKDSQVEFLRSLHGISDVLKELEDAGVLKYILNDLQNPLKKEGK